MRTSLYTKIQQGRRAAAKEGTNTMDTNTRTYRNNIITERGINAWMRAECECGWKGYSMPDKDYVKRDLKQHRAVHPSKAGK